MLCSQVTATMRSPRVTSFTRCMLEEGYMTASPAFNFTRLIPESGLNHQFATDRIDQAHSEIQ